MITTRHTTPFFALVAAALVLSASASVAAGQRPMPQPPPGTDDRQVRLPNGKLQTDEVLKHDHQKNLKDAEELKRLTEEVKADLEKNEQYVLSLPTLKKLEQIEKLAKTMRTRLKRF